MAPGSYLAQLSANMNGGPRVRSLAQTKDDIQHSPRVQYLTNLAAEIGRDTPAQFRSFAVNDDAGLKPEADVMGEKAAVVFPQDGAGMGQANPQPQTISGLREEGTLDSLSSTTTGQHQAMTDRKAMNTLQRKAKVEKFGSLWKKGPLVDDTNAATQGRNANLHIKVAAVFSNKDGNNPADAEYKQFVKDKWEITNPAHRRRVVAESDWHDDGYSKAADVGGGSDPALLRVQDFPGLHHSAEKQDGLLQTDDLTATFSAKQQIIDTSNDNEVIAELGEHSATITGTHPRAFTGVPARVGDEP